jgi:hypothetical protein
MNVSLTNSTGHDAFRYDAWRAEQHAPAVCAMWNGIKQDVTHFALSYHAIETLQLCCQLATALEKCRASIFIRPEFSVLQNIIYLLNGPV